MNVESIARICYETNRVFCQVTHDAVPPEWSEAPQAVRDGYCTGVQFRLKNPMAPAAAQHDLWCETKLSEGWCRGPVKSEELREHPNLVPYQALPLTQRMKDTMFKNTVIAMAPLYRAACLQDEQSAKESAHLEQTPA